jgi:hypothetical protein
VWQVSGAANGDDGGDALSINHGHGWIKKWFALGLRL